MLYIFGGDGMPRVLTAFAVGTALLLFLTAKGFSQDGAVSSTASAPASAAPVPSPGMTLADFERLAEQNNPTLTQAAARVEMARAELAQAGRYPNPRTGYLASEIGNDGRAGQQGGYVGQEVVLNGKLRHAREAASLAVREAECAYAAQRARVTNDVRRAFYDVLIAQRTIDVADQLVHIGKEGVQTTEQLLKAKEVSRAEVLQTRIEADSARIFAERARNRHIAAWRQLTAVLGTPDLPGTPLQGEIHGDLQLLNFDETLQRLLHESPVMAEVCNAEAKAEANLRRQRAERIPNVDFQVSMQYDNATQDTIAGVQAGVPLPIFKTNRPNVDRAMAELTVARGEVRRTALQLQQQLATEFEQYQNARYQVEKYSGDILPNAKKSLDLAIAGRQQGEISYLILLMTQRTYFQANLAYLEAVRELRAATISIEGNLLRDSLQK